jgi:hypothetical protein
MRSNNRCDIFCKIADGITTDDLFNDVEDDYEELDDNDREVMLDYFFGKDHQSLTEHDLSEQFKEMLIQNRLEEVVRKMRAEDLNDYWEMIDATSE